MAHMPLTRQHLPELREPRRRHRPSGSSSSLLLLPSSLQNFSPTSNNIPNPSSLAPSPPPLYRRLTVDDDDLAPDPKGPSPSSPITMADKSTDADASEDELLRIPGAQLHLIDRHRSHPLAAGDLQILRIRSGDTSLAAIAAIGTIQWPLVRDVASVKLDRSHYSFSLTVPASPDDPSPGALHYGLTLSSPDPRLDGLLVAHTSFSVQSIVGGGELGDVVPGEVEAAAYWTAVAPNVEDYGRKVASAITTGAVHVAKGVLWCGDVSAERLRWGNEVLKKRIQIQPSDADAEVSQEMLSLIKRVKKVTQMSEKVASGILCGVAKFTGSFAISVASSKTGKMPFKILPEEIVLASLDGFGKICDALEVAWTNVLSTSSTVTTDLVTHKYGEKVAAATNEGLDAAGHAIGAAWAVFKIGRALNPKSLLKPTSLVKLLSRM